MKRIHHRRHRRPQRVEPRYRVNDRIFAPQVLVIDEGGARLGEMTIGEARKIAQERELDVVEVGPTSTPPVCKIVNYGKFQYQQSRKERHSKQKHTRVDIKGIRISLRTDEHDLEFKKQQTEKFISKGKKVKIEIILRGREKAHQDLAKENLKKFIARINFPFSTEEEIKRFPGGFNTLITPQ